MPFGTKSSSLIIEGGLKIEGCKIEGLLYRNNTSDIKLTLTQSSICCGRYYDVVDHLGSNKDMNIVTGTLWHRIIAHLVTYMYENLRIF